MSASTVSFRPFHGFGLEGQFYVVVHETQLFGLHRLLLLRLRQHHRNLVLVASQRRELHLGFQLGIVFEEGPPCVGSVPLQCHKQHGEYDIQPQQERLNTEIFQISKATFLDFHNKTGSLPLFS